MRHPFEDARRALDQFLADHEGVERVSLVARELASLLSAGGKILACGNGGSLCDAQHFCEELTGRFRADRPPLAAIACTDPGHLTCTANDFGYHLVFARWIEALARPGDALVLLSTSGNSPNIAAALDAADRLGLYTVALLGKDGGAIHRRARHQWIVPGQTSDRIQELHMLILHALVEGIERAFGYGS